MAKILKFRQKRPQYKLDKIKYYRKAYSVGAGPTRAHPPNTINPRSQAARFVRASIMKKIRRRR